MKSSPELVLSRSVPQKRVSLQDWNLRVFLKRIWDDQQKYDYKSWAIQRDPDEVDRELWRYRKVEIIGVALDEYVTNLERRINALPAMASGSSG